MFNDFLNEILNYEPSLLKTFSSAVTGLNLIQNPFAGFLINVV